MKLTLNVYGKVDGKRQVVKVYESDTIFVETGIVEDLLNCIDLSQLQVKELNNDSYIAIGGMLINAFKQIKPLVQDVFDMPDEDFRHTSQKEVLGVGVSIVKESFSDLMSVITAQNEKN